MAPSNEHRYARHSAKKITVHSGNEQMFGAEEQILGQG
jgi:hypothetical protein